MKKAISVHKKSRGRPATGQDPLISARIPASVVASIGAWQSKNGVTRSEAIRRLVELGLTVKARPKQPSRARADKAKAMAANQLDRLADESATTQEQASRKGRLLKGPEEFQNVRRDSAKKNK